MIGNYLKIAYRNLLKNKFISGINLFGLTVGLTCCLLITLYIIHELSYDRYHRNADRIYRVTRRFNTPEGKVNLFLGTISPPFGPLLENDFREIQKLTRLLPNGNTPMKYQEKMFTEKNVYFADENLFDVFDVSVVKGNPATALTRPFHIMLSEDMARKYFGNEDPMDKEIRYDNNQNVRVSGIFKSIPSNSHIHPEFLLSFNTLRDTSVYGEENLRTNWGNNSFLTYILLPAHYDAKKLERQFPAFLDRHMSYLNPNASVKPSQTTALFLQKLTDIHLRSHLDYEAEENGDIKRIYIFSAIALFILLIACINYMNLSTARSSLRAREIGVRKAVGASRKEIIGQFLSESVVVAWLAALMALCLTWLLIPTLNRLTGQVLSIGELFKNRIFLLGLLVPFAVGLISGLYPAMFMSSFQPVRVLKGLFKAGGGNISIRKALVTAQFAISIILIIATAVVFRQLRYIHQKDLGFNREHIITIPYYYGLNEHYESFRNEMLNAPGMINVARSSRIPTGRLLDAMDAATEVADTMQLVNADIKFVTVDQDFIPTYGVKVTAGRNFSRQFGTDTSSYMINEAALSVLGWNSPKEAVGKMMAYDGRKGQIIGVVNNFHFESLHEKILPLVFIMPPPQLLYYGNLSVKVSGKQLPATLEHMQKVWHQFLPETPWEFTFLDENFNRLYQAETREGTLFTIFSGIAIFIACLGLFGLSAFAISQRIKEIGIRKVLGASTGNLVSLLSTDFLKLVGLASLIAFPIAWYAMNRWLQDFAYRIQIPWWIFLVSAILAGIVALATISFQAVKAALSNPVKNLRTE